MPNDASPYAPPQTAVDDAEPAAEAAYGGFWRRFAASGVDGVLIAVAVMVLMAVTVGFGSERAPAFAGVLPLLAIVAIWLYFAGFESGAKDATPGKRLLKLAVRRPNGERVGFGRATGRFFGRYLSQLLLYIGYLIQPFTQRRQTLHDMITDTVVVETGRASGAIVALIIVVGLAVPVTGILAAIAIPQYVEYQRRAMVLEGVQTARAAAAAVTAYYVDRQQVPASLREAGFTAPASPHLALVEVNPKNGVITVQFAGSALAGKRLLYVPERATDGQINWYCASEDLPEKQLPSSCRKAAN